MGSRPLNALLLAALALAAPARAEPPEEELAALRYLFQQGIRDAEANERARVEALRLLAQSPGDPLLTAYLGSSETLLARDAWLPWNKLHHVDRGLSYLDQALRAVEPAPGAGGRAHWQVQEVRLIAADTFLALPRMFNTADEGKRLLDQLLADPLLAQAPEGLRAGIYLCAAGRAQRAGQPAQARAWLERVRPLIHDEARLAQMHQLEEQP